MYRYFCLILLFFSILFAFLACEKEDIDIISGINDENFGITQIDEVFTECSENIPPIPQGLYSRVEKHVYSPDGKMIFIYNSRIFESLWGPVYDAPIAYLYDKENRILATYDIFEMIFKGSWG